jgi:hypothetical protein
MSLMRHFSVEAIASALAPKVQHWYRGDQRRIPTSDAAMALAGVEPIARAFLIVSWGLGAEGERAVCTRYLMGAAGWEAEAEQWPVGRLARMADMALDDLSVGYAVAEQWSEKARAARLGVSESLWHRRWKGRYRRVLADALEQVSRAHQAMARRVGEDGD